MIGFLGILLGDDCFIGANEWFREWWRHVFPAKLVTVSATWGFDGRKLLPGVWPADSATAWTLSQRCSPEGCTKSPSSPTDKSLRKKSELSMSLCLLTEYLGEKNV